MTEGKTNWVRDLLIIPLTVGVVVAFFTFVLPKILEKGNELSYSIDEPITYLDRPEVHNVKIEVNGVHTSSLFAYKVRLWNSGGVPIKHLPVRFVFKPDNTSFTIFNVSQTTKPEFEFGQITEEGSDTLSKRFVYELFNPKDEVNATFLTNGKAELLVFAKVEGLTLSLVKATQPMIWWNVLAIIIGILASILSLGLRRYNEIFNVVSETIHVAEKVIVKLTKKKD
jgi:hypothetical protein